MGFGIFPNSTYRKTFLYLHFSERDKKMMELSLVNTMMCSTDDHQMEKIPSTVISIHTIAILVVG